MRVLNTAQMREADRKTIEELGVPSIELMENAGRRVVEAMGTLCGATAGLRVAVLCGTGNNGGDGLVVARLLHGQAAAVSVYLFGAAADVRGDARVNLEAAWELDLSVIEVGETAVWIAQREAVVQADVVVDALFGTGLSQPLTGLWERAVADLNRAPVPVVSVDLPSGLSADSHMPIGPAVQAAMTVTLGAPKVPLVLLPAATCAGQLVVGDIGIPPAVFDGLEGPELEVVTEDAVRQLVMARPLETHKGDVGRVLIVAGSVGKTGAACLAGRGALRGGAGLVTVATPTSCVPTVAAGAPEYMTLPLAETTEGGVAADALATVLGTTSDVVALGPGLGTGSGAAALVKGVLGEAGPPVVLDADALNICAADVTVMRGGEERDVIVTPHPGEMARLCGISIGEVQADRVAAARKLAFDQHVYVVLKGARTLLATPDGQVLVNLTGSPGMATGGTGDVLTGMIAAWMGQLGHAAAACTVAVYLHGLAGELAAERYSEVAMTASDLVEAIGAAVREVRDSEPERGGNGTDRPRARG